MLCFAVWVSLWIPYFNQYTKKHCQIYTAVPSCLEKAKNQYGYYDGPYHTPKSHSIILLCKIWLICLMPFEMCTFANEENFWFIWIFPIRGLEKRTNYAIMNINNSWCPKFAKVHFYKFWALFIYAAFSSFLALP